MCQIYLHGLHMCVEPERVTTEDCAAVRTETGPKEYYDFTAGTPRNLTAEVCHTPLFSAISWIVYRHDHTEGRSPFVCVRVYLCLPGGDNPG